MDKSTVVPKKKRGPAPTGKGTQIQVRIHDEILEPLDAFIESEEGKPSRPEAIRRILNDWLKGHGYLTK